MSKAIARTVVAAIVVIIILVGLAGVYGSALLSSSSVSTSATISSLPTGFLSQNSTNTNSNSSSIVIISTRSSHSSYTSSSTLSSETLQKNLSAFILLNNLVESSTAYRIFDTMYIESWSNDTTTGLMLWSVNHTTSITINSTTMYVQPHYNCGIMHTFGPLIQWPVFAIYNWTNIPFPVTVYIGNTTYDPSNYGIANTTATLPAQSYFVAGYVSDGQPFIMYSSLVNETNVNVVVNNAPPCSGNSA